MARAKRHYIPGYAWHITHRCHRKDFLLKFRRDRRLWLHWLFDAKKRYGLCILNYMVTCNHIHLLVLDCGDRSVIPRSIQLLAGRTGQEYNQRKDRKGAFWEDRYHATAVETDDHLVRCIVYMDLNMVRAGVVSHPSGWEESGYHEIQSPRQRYGLIDHARLMSLLGMPSIEMLQQSHREWVQATLQEHERARERQWTESIAVGSRSFLEGIKDELRTRAAGRSIVEEAGRYSLREGQASYNSVLGGKNEGLSPQNGVYWQVYDLNTIG